MRSAARSFRLEQPYDLARTLRPLADGGGDPTWRFEPTRVIRAMWSPEGAATVEITKEGSTLFVRAFGPGSDWIADRSSELTGLSDNHDGFNSALHPLTNRLHREHPGMMFARSLTTWDLVVPTVLGQRVTTSEARSSWRQIVRRFGHAAPGSSVVRLPPTPDTIASLSDHHWHVAGVERGRADTIRRLLAVLGALDRTIGDPGIRGNPDMVTEFRQVVESVPGSGPWTATALAIAVFGDPDVVQLGDLHIPHIVTNALAGEPRGHDERMVEILEPFRPHRGRVVRLIKLAGPKPARRGPKYTPMPIARM